MPIKVEIAKGKGKVSCVLPGFHLDEKKRPSVIIEEVTNYISDLESRGIIKLSEINDGDIDGMLKKASKAFTKRARDRRIAELEREKETGGVEMKKEDVGKSFKSITSKEPASLTPDEVRAVASAELKAIKTGDKDDLNEILNIVTDESGSV